MRAYCHYKTMFLCPCIVFTLTLKLNSSTLDYNCIELNERLKVVGSKLFLSIFINHVVDSRLFFINSMPRNLSLLVAVHSSLSILFHQVTNAISLIHHQPSLSQLHLSHHADEDSKPYRRV